MQKAGIHLTPEQLKSMDRVDRYMLFDSIDRWTDDYNTRAEQQRTKTSAPPPEE